MHSTNYRNTLIMPSPDTRATAAVAPDRPGTIAQMQYDMIAAAPYARDSDEVISRIAARRKAVGDADYPAFRAAFLARGQACLRTSPLVRSHGWAIHHDDAGHVALLDPASAACETLAADPAIKVIAGMRSARK